jgi:glycosyltransferase involved in cell wall biosynthesis
MHDGSVGKMAKARITAGAVVPSIQEAQMKRVGKAGKVLGNLRTPPAIVMLLAKAFQTDTRPRQEARTLVRASYSVRVIAWDRACEFSSREWVEGALVRSFRLTNLGRSGSLGLVIGGALFQAPAFVEILRAARLTQRNVIVHAHDVDTLPAAALARMIGLCRGLVYDCHELGYGAYSELFGCLIGGIVRALELILLRSADRIVAVSEPIARSLGDMDIEVICNCPWLSEIPSISKEEARKKLGLPLGAFIISYVGLVRYDSRLDIMLRVADLAQRQTRELHFLVVGPHASSEDHGYLLRLSSSMISVVGPVDHRCALMFRIASDLTWAVYDDPASGINTRVGLPWQVFESIACGVPVVVWRSTHRASLVSRLGCGLVVDGNDAKGILKSIEELSQDLEMQARLSSNAISASLLEYSWEKMSNRLLQVYEGFVVRNSD